MSQSTDKKSSAEEAMNEEAGDSGVSRRRLLASGAATWASVSVAGCPGDGGDGETATETAPGTATETETETETATPEPQPENYVVTTETWAGSSGVPASIGFMSACATTNTFVPGMQVVFFVGVFDPETGEKLGSGDLDSVQVSLGDGMETVALSWSDEHGHAAEGEGSNWVGSWTLPEDIEPAEMSYTVELSGSEGSFQNVGVLTDTVDIVAYDNPANLVVDTETRWNGHPAPEYTNGFVEACAPERQFSTDMGVTFVIGLYDSTNGNIVGQDGLYVESATPPEEGNPDSLSVSDESSPYNDGIDSLTVISPDGAFEDIELTWTDAADDSHGMPRWFSENPLSGLDPGTYSYEIKISDETSKSLTTGIAADSFTVLEVPN